MNCFINQICTNVLFIGFCFSLGNVSGFTSHESRFRRRHWQPYNCAVVHSSNTHVHHLTPHSDNEHEKMLLRDLVDLSRYVFVCLAVAAIITVYEGVECSYLKPASATIRIFPTLKTDNLIDLMTSSTRGMGRGEIDRNEEWYRDTYGTSLKKIDDDATMVTLPQKDAWDIPSYNEIMENHRIQQIPTWKRGHITKPDVLNAVEDVLRSLRDVQDLKVDATDYNYDNMYFKLPQLIAQLSYSTSILQQAKGFLSNQSRETIGFDWGSCAWRLCGAKADAQEALAELYNSIGMFEPYECLFTLDIVERSIRDIIDVIPDEYKSSNVDAYVPYQSKNAPGENGDVTSDEEYLNALTALRNLAEDADAIPLTNPL